MKFTLIFIIILSSLVGAGYATKSHADTRNKAECEATPFFTYSHNGLAMCNSQIDATASYAMSEY